MKKALLKVLLVPMLVVGVPFSIYAQSVIDVAYSGAGVSQQFGSTGQSYVGMSYLPSASHSICTIGVYVANNGAVPAPSDMMKISVLQASTTNGDTWNLPAQLVPVTSGVPLGVSNAQAVTNTSFALHTFNFTPCITLAGGSRYNFVLGRTGAVNATSFYLWNTLAITPSGAAIDYYVAQWAVGFPVVVRRLDAGNSKVSMIFNGTENFGVSDVTPPTFGGEIFDQLNNLNEENSTSTNNIAAFATVLDILNSKYPFNYLGAFATSFDLFGTATTSTFYAYTLGFNALGIGSTTPMGNILPNWTFLSTTSVSTYYPDAIRLRMYYIAGMAMFVGWVFMMYRRITSLFYTSS